MDLRAPGLTCPRRRAGRSARADLPTASYDPLRATYGNYIYSVAHQMGIHVSRSRRTSTRSSTASSRSTMRASTRRLRHVHPRLLAREPGASRRSTARSSARVETRTTPSSRTRTSRRQWMPSTRLRPRKRHSTSSGRWSSDRSRQAVHPALRHRHPGVLQQPGPVSVHGHTHRSPVPQRAAGHGSAQ